jgi:hypothetical protein
MHRIWVDGTEFRWTRPQRHEDDYGFKGLQSRPTTKVVILDQENPPQPRSARTAESED